MGVAIYAINSKQKEVNRKQTEKARLVKLGKVNDNGVSELEENLTVNDDE